MHEQVRSDWQDQRPMTPLTSSLLRRVARRFNRKSRLAGIVDASVFGALAIFFSAVAWFGEITLCRVGCALLGAALFYSMHRQVHDNWKDWSSEERTHGCIDFYRSQLIRRRDLSRSFPLWSILPAAPGVAIASLGWILAEPHRWPDAIGPLLFWVGLQVALFRHNREKADAYQREIDLLTQ